MPSWLTILKTLLSLAGWVLSFVVSRKLMSAGEAAAIKRGLEKHVAQVDKAMAARRAVRSNPDAGNPDADDGFRRD